MPPRRRPSCLVCQSQPSRYACASCRADYCSVACYKRHQETCSPGSSDSVQDVSAPLVQVPPELEPEPKQLDPEADDPPSLQDPPPLRPLTTLKWPYVPDTSAYPDPLTRDDPKPLQLHQYEAIATSPTIRALLTSHPRLCALLTTLNDHRGAERERALERALGVDGRLLKNSDEHVHVRLDEDTRAFRQLAEAIESAVRGGREDVLGLDWDRV